VEEVWRWREYGGSVEVEGVWRKAGSRYTSQLLSSALNRAGSNTSS